MHGAQSRVGVVECRIQWKKVDVMHCNVVALSLRLQEPNVNKGCSVEPEIA
jgi:hypothetical protein